MDGPAHSVPATANPYVAWLLSEGWNISKPEELVGRLAEKIVDMGLPLFRMRVLIHTLHPQTFATHYTWRADTRRTKIFHPPHEIQQKPIYLESPIAKVFEGSGAIRRRLDVPEDELDFPFLKELKAEGGTDYVVFPLLFNEGPPNAITLASTAPGGFNGDDLKPVEDMLPVLARIMELHATRQTARTLLDTYIGGHTGKRILDGLVKRGDGEVIHSVIWFCDLRDSVRLAENMKLEDFLDLLNEFFDCMAGAVLAHGGEVLRFIGDAALAIFPFEGKGAMFSGACHSEKSACARSLAAAREARKRIRELNERRAAEGKEALRFGLALHVGNLMYANIGTPDRLEFTVIGKAANEAARLEEMSKVLGHQIVISPAFPRCNSKQLVSQGHHRLRGFSEDWEIYSLSEDTDPACTGCYEKGDPSKPAFQPAFGMKGCSVSK